MLLDDARKEFSLSARTGFGHDGDAEMAEADFIEVRGSFEDNDLVREIERHITAKTALGDNLVSRLKNIHTL